MSPLPHLEAVLATVYGELPQNGRLIPLQGEASTRLYYRYVAEHHRPPTLVVMQLPKDSLTSDEADRGPRAQRLPFLDVQAHLLARGLPVPRVYAEDLAHGLVLLEDLGDETFERHLAASEIGSWESLYEQAIDLLVQMQRACPLEQADDCIAYKRSFDTQLLRWELDHFKDYGLIAPFGPLSATEEMAFERAADRIVSRVGALPRGFVHRDFQSRNLMWDASGRLRLIDFQDALVGPRVYDLVALLCDSYVTLSGEQQRRLISHYARVLSQDPTQVVEAFHWVTAQRKLKDAGRFVYIDRVRGNSSFLPHYPQSLVYADRALCALGLDDLRGLLAARIHGYPDNVSVPAPSTGSGAL